jgi:serine/threonine protein kinase
MNDVPRLLSAIQDGDPGAASQLLPLVYDELRRLAAQKLAHENPDRRLNRPPWSTKRICGWLAPRTCPAGGKAAAVRDDHVVQIYAVEEHPRPYLVMEYIPGQTLQQKLDATGPLETSEMVRLAEQIARGLAAAHAQGLIHRDIKPSNILLEQGAEIKAKLTDFGLARTMDDASLTQSGVIAGTPLYMAPEQAQGDPIDHRTDLFSLGSVFYVMLSGRPPFRAPTTMAVLKWVCEDMPRPIHEIIPEAPPWLCDLISKLHAKKPEHRFQAAQEVADLLAQPPAGSGSKGRRSPTSRPRRWKWLAATVLLLAVGLSLDLAAKRLTNLAATILGQKDSGPAGEAKVEGPPVPPDDPAPPDATAPKFKKSLNGHTQAVLSVTYSPDGWLLASGDEAGEVRVWNVPDGTPRYVLPARGPVVHTLAFSPDGKFLLTASARGNGDIHIWDAETGKLDSALKGHTNGLFEVSFGPTVRPWFSPGGTPPSASGTSRRGAKYRRSPRPKASGYARWLSLPAARSRWGAGERYSFWDRRGSSSRRSTRARGRCASPPTAGSDGGIRLWEVATQHQLAELRHEGRAYQLAFSPDGVTLATTGQEDRLVKLWDVSFLRSLKTRGRATKDRPRE